LVEKKYNRLLKCITNLHASSFSTRSEIILKQKPRTSLPNQPSGQEFEIVEKFSNVQLVVTFPTVNNLRGRPGSGRINPFTKESLQSLYCFWYK